MSIQGFAENFLDQQPPAAFVALWDAYNDETMMVPDGLELYEDGDGNSGIEAGWSSDPEALSRLFGFAQANHSGSVYALWQAEEWQGSDDMPVVLFGDEGGQLIVARNAREFIKLLSCNISPYIETNWDTNEEFVSFVAEDEDEESAEWADEVQAFQAWIQAHFGYEPITAEEAMECVSEAQAEYQVDFEEWFLPFLP